MDTSFVTTFADRRCSSVIFFDQPISRNVPQVGLGTVSAKALLAKAMNAAVAKTCYDFAACTAVAAMVFTMSSTEQPRERSLQGLASPWRTAKHEAPPRRCAIL